MFEVGKSSLLTALTGVQSEVAAYEFTTLTCIPGWECGAFNESGGFFCFFPANFALVFLRVAPNVCRGVINYNDCKIQLLDLPGIISGAAQGKGWALWRM